MKRIFLLVIIIFIFTIGCSNKSHGTIEEITGIEFNKINYIKIGGALNQNENYDVEEFINKYKELKYKKISGEYGSTAHMYFVCYDQDDKPLFTLVEVGNQDKVFIKKGTFNINKDNKYLYQLDN